MHFMARLSLLALAALLTACAGNPPAKEASNPFPIVDGSADDVLISAIGLVGTGRQQD